MAVQIDGDERDDNNKKSEGLTRAVSSVTALQLGVSGDASIAGALRHLYEATRKSLLDSVLNFDAGAIRTIRQDYIDILRAMNGAQSH